MKDFTLKYGCNPNQKPACIYMEDGSDLPVEILTGIYQFPGCTEQLAAGQRAEEESGPSGGGVFQTCQSDFRSGGHPDE